MGNVFFDIKTAFLSENPIDAIMNNRYLIAVVDELMGAQHPRFHAEGDAWEHTKLAITNMQAIPDHDWYDILLALFHDVGKKMAFRVNDGKNLAGHEKYSVLFFRKWVDEIGLQMPYNLYLDCDWIIINHMNAHHLHEYKSAYDVMNIVTHPLFPRLARLAKVDSMSTLAGTGKPLHDFNDVLNSPNVKRWLGKPQVLPIVSIGEYQDRFNIPFELAAKCADLGLKMQINGNITNPQYIINGVTHDHVLKRQLREANQCQKW